MTVPDVPEQPGQASDEQAPRSWRPTKSQIALSVASLALAAVLIIVVLPKAAGADWSEAFGVMGRLSVWSIVAMTCLWALGLSCYTFVYTGSLPGLTHPKALALNLTGSLVSNMMPFGGAAGVATTYGIAYSWGFGGVNTSLMILVSGLANLLIRIILPLAGVAALLASDVVLPDKAGSILIFTLLTLVAVAAAIICILANSRFAAAIGGAGDWVLRGSCRLARRHPPRHSLKAAAIRLQGRSGALLARGWPRVTFGMAAYYGSEMLLFYVALKELGSPLAWPELIATFALSRVLTAVVITPAGSGISEAGTASLLVLFGTPPAVAAAAVLILYFYTFLIEIPVGLAAWGWVAAMRGRWGKRHLAKPST